MARRHKRLHRESEPEPVLSDYHVYIEAEASDAVAVLEVIEPVIADLPSDHGAHTFLRELRAHVKEAQANFARDWEFHAEDKDTKRNVEARQKAIDLLIEVAQGDATDVSPERILAAGELMKARF